VLISGQVAAERKNSQPAFPNEDTRKAEVVRRLETDPEYQKLKMKLQDARVNLAFAEAELERAKADHAGLVAMTGLITAMVNAGKIDDVERFVHDVLGSDNLSDKHQTRDSGNAGCNNYFGTYQVEGNTLTFNEIGSTKMFCGDGLMAEESAFLTALQEATAYKITSGSLQIFAADDSTLISLSLVK